MRNVDSRLARTLNDLLEYDFEIEYLTGKDNVVADHLSRNIVNSEMEINDSVEADFSVLLSPPGRPVCMIDCLFDQIQRSLSLNNIWKSLLVEKNGLQEKPKKFLRQLLVEELLKNPKKYKIGNKNRYIKSMTDSENAPSFDFFNAFSNIFNCIIYVVLHNSFIMKFDFCHNSNHNESAYLNSLSGGHIQVLQSNNITKGNTYLEQKIIPFGGGRPSNTYASDLGTFSSMESLKSLTSEFLSPESKNGEPLLFHFLNDDIDMEDDDTVRSSRVCNHLQNRISKVEVTINNDIFCSVLDTGSSVNMIFASILSKLSKVEVESLPEKVQVQGFEGIFFIEKYVLLDVCISDFEIKKLPFAIIEDHVFGIHSNFCLILSINTLKKINCILDFSSDRLVLGNCTIDFTPKVNEQFCFCGECLSIPKNEPFPNFVVGFIKAKQRNRELSQLKEFITNRRIDKKLPIQLKRYSRLVKFIEYSGEILLFKRKDQVKVPLFPFRFVTSFTIGTHFEMGHIGRDKLFELISQSVFHPDLRKTVSDVANTCPKCQLNKLQAQVPHPPIIKIQTNNPFQIIAMDLLALPFSRNRNSYALTCIDHNSKFLYVVPIKNKQIRN